MRFISAALATTAVLSASTLATPLVAEERAAKSVFENSPWQLSNIIIFESAENGTSAKPSTVNFDIKDTNTGIKFKTHCSRTVKPGESLYDGQYRSCGPASLELSWNIDENKNVAIQRSFVDPAVGPPPEDVVTCFGSWQLNPHPFEVRSPAFTGPLQGTNYTQGCLEVYCTQAIA